MPATGRQRDSLSPRQPAPGQTGLPAVGSRRVASRGGWRLGSTPSCLALAAAILAALAATIGPVRAASRAVLAWRAVGVGVAGAGPASPAAPSPAASTSDLAAERSRMEEADRDFARLSRRQGMRAAFLAYMADDAVLFRPGPVPGRAFVEARPSPAIELVWAPVYAAMAVSGDLGYTTGPYEVRGTGPDHAVEDQGYYVTIWRKQADGSWKVALDQGVSTPPAMGADAAALAAAGAGTVPAEAAGGAPGAVPGMPPASPGAAGSTVAAAPVSDAARAMLAADAGFAGDAVAHGARAAFMGNLAQDARLYRAGALPAVGRDAIAQALGAGRQLASSWQPTAAAASVAGDLGYTYGNAALMGAGAPRRVQQSSVYLRLWRRQGGDSYKIVLDLVKPLPPPPPP
jgi:ketosteroid isomerase-like protein